MMNGRVRGREGGEGEELCLMALLTRYNLSQGLSGTAGLMISC